MTEDVWLWRARFFKTRSLAARVVEEGGVRLLRGRARTPVDKPSRPVRCGDVLTFAQGPRWVVVKVEALGERRGPAPEARALYSALTDAGGATGADVAPEMTGYAVEGGDFNHTHG
jgi:ribosome-associated heat shock protein Hsp15